MKAEKLIYASTEASPDMLYFAKMNIPDPVFAFTSKGRKCAIFSRLEIGRARRESAFDEIFESASPDPCDDLAAAFSALGIRRVEVPEDFPAGMYVRLASGGLGISVRRGPFFPQREIKAEWEAGEIAKANAAASSAFARVREVLSESSVSGRFIKWRGRHLTSEALKFEIEAACLRMGAESKHTIAAAGDQACDPHCEGFGKIRAGSLMVFDIFPRMKSSGYYGDMTRTFLKGAPSDAQSRLVETVRLAQDEAMKLVKAGARADRVHARAAGVFESRGFKTSREGGEWRGFFHSTGHGLGLEVHESPRLGTGRNILRAGQVVTVEPGLYYPGLGGCRIEDNVLVGASGCRKLSDYPYDWVVR